MTEPREKRIVEVTQCAGCEAIHRLATEQERERIIKLLETQAEVTGYVEIELGKLIALIKEENK